MALGTGPGSTTPAAWRDVVRPSGPIAITPISPAIGAEIGGIDLAADIDAPTFAAVRQVWYDHNLLLFRSQDLPEPAQIRFAGRFGALAEVVNENGDDGALPGAETLFHSDQCYLERPCLATTLHAVEVPASGGTTFFANTYAAYETLPTALRQRIAGRKAMNVLDDRRGAARRGAESAADLPRFAHPIVRTHPVTGRKALFVNRRMTERILDMRPGDSDAILAALFDHQERPEFLYEHAWRPGDLVVWDNRCTLRADTRSSAAGPRLLRRVAVVGEKPF